MPWTPFASASSSPQHTDVAELRAIWQVADEAGFDKLWNFDHFAAITGDPELDVLEGWTLLEQYEPNQ